MAISSDALFSNLLEDLSPYLSSTQIRGLLNEEKVPLDPWMGPYKAAAVSLGNSFYSKYVEGATNRGEVAAFRKFIAANERCEHYKLSDHVATSWDDELVGEFKKLLYHMLYPEGTSTFELHEILSEARDGPGSSIQVTGTDSYSKLFSSRGSTTCVSLAKYIEYFFAHDHRWVSAFKIRQEHYGDRAIVEGSKLSFAPKNRDVMRSICTEPSLNMFYQLGLGKILEKRLLRFTGIDLATQPDKNRSLTKLGSQTGRFATIDLASASDTISVSLLREVLPKQFFQLLMKLRCKQTRYKNEDVALHMVSTMGNGFTFPLQTIIFTCAVLAVYRVYGRPYQSPFGDSIGNYGIFGDDIIVETEMFRPVCRFLEMLGFVVNAGKSFSEGPFRESCGEDYYNGVNIRGVYVETLSTEQDVAVLVNRLNDFTARTGIPVPNTVGYLLRWVRFQPVPLAENDDAGIKVPYSMLKSIKLDKHVQSIRYYRWVARPSYLTVDCQAERIFGPRGTKPRIFNSEGLWLAFLLGGMDDPVTGFKDSRKRGPSVPNGLRDSRISVRLDRVRYERRKSISPNWDHLPTALGMKSPCRNGSLLCEAIWANHHWLAPPVA